MPAKSEAQQKVMGMAHAIQKGEMKGKPGMPATKIAATMEPEEVEEFARTKHKGLPERRTAGSGKKDLRRAKGVRRGQATGTRRA